RRKCGKALERGSAAVHGRLPGAYRTGCFSLLLSRRQDPGFPGLRQHAQALGSHDETRGSHAERLQESSQLHGILPRWKAPGFREWRRKDKALGPLTAERGRAIEWASSLDQLGRVFS